MALVIIAGAVLMIFFCWLVIKAIVNRVNAPTWKGIIISAMFGALPFYLLMCWLGVWGVERTEIDN